MKRKKTNPRVSGLIKSLYKKSEESKEALWKDVAKRLESPGKNWAEVNLSKLNRLTAKGETILVPGKVPGTGSLDHSINLYSFSASKAVSERVSKAGGSYNKIEDLLEKSAKGVRIFK